MALLEPIAVATALASVWLLLRMRIANWPMGLASVSCYAVLFFQAKLYADALLQLVFFAFGVAGWRRWALGRREANPVRVARATGRDWQLGAGAAAAGIALASWLLASFTDSPLPFFDAAIAVLSLWAIWWQAFRFLECWWVWIAVDVISIPVYVARDLPLTAALYAVFLGLCVAGVLAWRRQAA